MLPRAPAHLQARGGSEIVIPDWDDSPDPDLLFYNVYRSETSASPCDKVASATASQYTDVDLTNGTQLFYVVTVVNTSSVESADWNEASATRSLTAVRGGRERLR